MLTIEECREILNKDIKNYTDEQLKAISNLISDLADVYLKPTNYTHDEEESGNIY